MDQMLCFFPWMPVDHEITFGDMTLVPYVRHAEPFGTNPNQAIADALLEPYKDGMGEPIDHATLLRVQDHAMFDVLSDIERANAFDLSELLAVGGLAARRFFEPMQYVNRDNYILYIQGFTDPAGGAAVTSRRREGTTTNFVSRDLHVERRPAHVPAVRTAPFDVDLVRALIDAGGDPKWPDIWEAALNFNHANTDRTDTTEAVECVLTMGAFERLFGCRHGDESCLAEGIRTHITPTQDLPPSESCRIADDPLRFERFKKFATLREAWIADMFRTRGDFAHGRTATPRYPAIWLPSEHLFLSALAIPLCLKTVLERLGVYAMTDDDFVAVEAFERLIAHNDLFVEGPGHTWPFVEIMQDAVWARARAETAKRFP